MGTAMARRMLAVLLLCSLAFEVAVARGHRFYEDGPYNKARGGRRHRPRGKAKGYYAHKGTPTYPYDSHVPPPYQHVPDPVSSPESPPPLPAPVSSPPPYEQRELPSSPTPSPSATPPSYQPPLAASIQGLVLCQNCNYVGTSYYSYGKPLPGAVVKLTCESNDNSSFEAKGETDDHGYFLIYIPKFDFEKYDVVNDCKMYLLSSSTSTCNTPTDINYGISGSPIREQKTYTDKILYSSGPLVFAPKYCMPTPPPFMYQSPPNDSPPQHW